MFVGFKQRVAPPPAEALCWDSISLFLLPPSPLLPSPLPPPFPSSYRCLLRTLLQKAWEGIMGSRMVTFMEMTLHWKCISNSTRCCGGSEQRSPPRRGEGWGSREDSQGRRCQKRWKGRISTTGVFVCVCACVHIHKYCTLILNHSPTVFIAARSLNQTQSSPVWLV